MVGRSGAISNQTIMDSSMFVEAKKLLKLEVIKIIEKRAFGIQ